MNEASPSRLKERFDIVRRLGAGAMGIVYEANDRKTGERVAVKVLRSFDAKAHARFKREFRAVQGVEHPNLVRMHELFDDGDTLFFTMEMVLGADLLEFVRPRSRDDDGVSAADDTLEVSSLGDAIAAERRARHRHRFDEERLRSTLGQLVRAITALHEHGLVHRDVKPSNIVVTAAGQLRLLDFGLVFDLGPERSTSSHIVGTAAYMAPEQTAAAPVGPEADWYSVGVLLFEALTGQLPFDGSVADILVNKRLFDAPSPRAVVAGLPPELARLCEELMHRDPEARPGGRQIAATLGIELSPISQPVRSFLRRRSSSFMGRTRERERLRSCYERVVEHRSVLAVTVRGDSGAGKSALVQRFLDDLREDVPSAVVLGGRCYQSESVHYKGIDGIVEALTAFIRRLPREEAAALIPRHAAALVWQFPTFATVEALARSTSIERPSDPHAARAKALQALRELFLRITDRHPVVLYIDDLQWIDPDGFTVLQDLVRDPEPPPLLLISTLVPSAVGVAGFEPLRCAHEILELGPLSNDDASVLAGEFAKREGVNLGESDRAALVSESEGHPILLYELVRHAGLHRDASPEARPRLEVALWERVTALPVAQRDLVALACVVGGPVRLDVAAASIGLDRTSAVASAASLRAASLLFTSGAGVEITIQPFHDRVRAIVVQHLSLSERRSWHARFATALEVLAPSESEALAMHWSGAGSPDRAASHAALAGHGAAAALAFDRATELFRLALSGATGDAARRPLLVALGEALANGGRGAESARAYLEAATATHVAEDVLELRRRASDQLLRSGHIDEGLAAIREVLAAIEMSSASSPNGALAALLYHRARLAIRGLAHVGRSEPSIPPRSLRRIDICWSIGACLSIVDMIRGADFLTRGLILALEAGEPYRISRGLAMEAAIASAEGGRNRLRVPSLLAAAEELASQTTRPEASAWLALSRGIVSTQDGRFEAGHRFATEAEALFRDRCTGAAWEIASSRGFALWSLAFLGRLRDLAERLPALLRESEDHGDRFGLMNLTIGPVHVLGLARDETASMRSACDEVLARWSQSGFHFQHVCGLFTRTAADLYDGRSEAALSHLESVWSAVERSLLLRVQFFRLDLWGLRGRVALAAALRQRGRPPSGLVRTVRVAAERIEEERMAWSGGTALVLRAGLACLEGRPSSTTTDLLARAEVAFDRASMRMHGAACRLQRGLLLGRAGDEIASSASAVLEGEGVVRPERFASVFAPLRT